MRHPKQSVCKMIPGMFTALLCLVLLAKGLESKDDYFYKLTPDPNYSMWWKFDDEFITIKVSVKTKGWMFWGLSQTNDVWGADGVIGWVDNNSSHHFHDIHYNDTLVPIRDRHQDYTLLQMSENNDSTTMIFKRKLLPDDKTDFLINLNTMRIQWGWGAMDPPNDQAISPFTKRGVTYNYLLDYAYQWNRPLPEHYKTFEVRMPDYKVPHESTVEVFFIQRIPDLGRKKQHIISVEPIISKGNENIVHHMKVFQLSSSKVAESLIGKVTRTLVEGSIIHGYAMHTGISSYPPEAGMALEREGNDDIIISLNVHYNRPPAGTVDSSGFRFYITDDLRKYDASLVQVLGTYEKGYEQIIPQQQQNFTEYIFFPSHCIKVARKKKMEPWKTKLDRIAEGLLSLFMNNVHKNKPTDEERPRLFAVLLHGHWHTKKIALRLVNEITGKEVQTIVVDSNYEYSFQGLRYLKQPVVILPNHRIDLECTRNTMDRTTPLMGGPTTQNEMCEAFLCIYPRLTTWRSYSLSTNKFTWGHRHLGWKTYVKWKGFHPDVAALLAPVRVAGKTYGTASPSYLPLNDASFWKNDTRRVKSFEEDGLSEPFAWQCLHNDDSFDEGLSKNKPRVLLKP